MKSKFLKLIAILCTLVMTLSFAVACGNDDNGGDGGNGGNGGKRTNIKFLYAADSNSMNAWLDLINAYNNGQGATDNVWVSGKMQTAYAGESEFIKSQSAAYNVVMVSDSQDGFQKLAIKYDNKRAANGFMVNLQPYADNDADFQNNAINEDTLNWWRMNFNKSAAQGTGAQKHVIGAGQNLIGVPIGASAQLNAYSIRAFEAQGVNIVSVAEDELDAYNAKNGASLKPHGYAEYKTAPVQGMKASKNLLGQEVYKVFNNRISMNWEEQRIFLRYFTKSWNSSSSTTYGFISEYWFNYGWSVGGDVMGFNGTDYDFTLLDESNGYLVVDNNVVINGTTYQKGDVVLYQDKVNTDMAALEEQGKVYAIASQYDAVKEYVSFQIARNTIVDERNGAKYYGYEVGNPDTGSAENYMQNGTIAMTRITSGYAYKYQVNAYDWVDFCPAEQYREYVGGSTYLSGTTEYLKVIGETYDGEVYTGNLKVVNGTKIVGDQTTAGTNPGLAIPACSDPEKYQAAWDFISWIATEGQQYIAKTGTITPVSKDVLFSDNFINNEEIAKGKNMYAVAVAAYNVQRGDWGYFESGEWVTNWANSFNSSVRRGMMTLTEFENTNTAAAKTALNNMYCVIKGIR